MGTALAESFRCLPSELWLNSGHRLAFLPRRDVAWEKRSVIKFTLLTCDSMGSSVQYRMTKKYAFLKGSGGVRELFRLNVEQHPGGALDNLPQSMLPILSVMLDSHMPTWICYGKELTFLYNDAYVSLLGSKHPEAFGRSLWSAWPEVRSTFEPIVSEAYAGNGSFSENVEFSIVRNGTPENSWFTFATTPIKDFDGSVLGVFATVNETTNQVLANRSKEEQGARLRTLFEQAPGFIAMLRGPSHVFEIVNVAFETLVGRSDLDGRSVRAALPEVVEQGFVELLDEVYRNGQPYVSPETSVQLMHASGEMKERWIKFVYQPILEVDGTVSGIFVEGSDVTDEHRARDQLAQNVSGLKLAEERVAFQLSFSDKIRHLVSPEEIIEVASSSLGKHLDAARVQYVTVRDDSVTFDLLGAWIADGVERLPQVPRYLADYGFEIHQSLLKGETVVVDEVVLDSRTSLHAEAYEKIGVAAYVCVPLLKNENLVALLSVHRADGINWSPRSVEIARDTAERTWDALERAQAHRALNEQHDESRQVLDSMTDGFIVIEPNWCVSQINAAGLVIGERSAETVIKHVLWDVWPEILGTEMELRYRRLMAEKAPEHFEQYLEFRSGSARWIELRVHFTHRGAMAVLYRDITERRAYEAQLQATSMRAQQAAAEAEQERRLLGALLEAAPVGIAMADAHGHLFRVNRANYALWGQQLPKSKSVQAYGEWKGWWADGSFRHGQQLQSEEWALARAITGEDVGHDVVEIETFDSPPLRRVITLSAAAVRDSEGAIVGGVVAQTDITALVEAENALRRADARKDEFLAMLAHELRNPLAPISSAADLLSVAALDQKGVERTGGLIKRQVAHLTALVDDLLDVSRVTQGLVSLDMELVNIAEVLSSAVEQVSPLIGAKAQRLTLTGAGQSASLFCDRKRMVQVVANLLNNAMKYTNSRGEINVDVEISEDSLQLTVSDNGIGMSSETVDQVFELFAQAARTSDRSQGGLGIGLALVRRLVELHGGTVSAYSAGLGQGSAFTLSLPRGLANREAQNAA